MEKKLRKSYLLAPLVVTAFLSSGMVFADDDTLSNVDSSSTLRTTTIEETSTSSLSENASEITTNPETSQSSLQEQATSGELSQASTTKEDENTEESTTADVSTLIDTKVDVAPTKTSSQQVSPSSPVGEENSKTTVMSSDEGARLLAKAAVTKQTAPKEPVTATLDDKGIKIQYNAKIEKNESIKFAVWSANNGQDDLVWYNADAAGAAYVELSKHKSYGAYYIHTYAFTPAAKGLNAMTITVPEPQVTTSISKASEGHFDILVKNVPATITSISVPVWSDKNGQDDLRWYGATQTAKGTFKVSVAVKDHHNDRGHYAAHIYGYSTVTGSMIGLTATSGFDNVDTRPNATVSMVDYAENKTSFKVQVTGTSQTKTISAVNIAVWSEKNGQDDLKWYSPSVSNNKATATVNIADLSNTSDNYIVHVYTTYSDETRVGTVLGTYKITKPVEKNDVKAELTKDGIALKLTSNTVSDYSKVKFAVWSSVNGQDDLRWYSANNDGTALAAYENHNGYGIYNIHTYSFENNQTRGLNATAITIEKPSVKTTFKQVNSSSFSVTISEIPQYITSIILPVWSEKNGQDDLKWTEAKKQTDGSYVALIDNKDHKSEFGKYDVHIYGNSKLDRGLVGLTATPGFTLNKPEAAKSAKPSEMNSGTTKSVASKEETVEKTKVAVENYDSEDGYVDIVVTQGTKTPEIRSIRVAAWSEDNQANLYWYVRDNVVNGRATVEVSPRHHQYKSGDYTIHAYVDYEDNTVEGFNLGKYNLKAEAPSYFVDISSHNGNISVDDFLSLKRQGIQGVVVKLTEGNSYQNPYARQQVINAQAAGIKVSVYHYSHFVSDEEARTEAQYFVNMAKTLNLPTTTLMVNDMEESKMLGNVNTTVQAWENEMKRLGYSNLVHYTMANWLDFRGGKVDTSKFGLDNFWIAHYPKGYTYMTQEEARTTSYYEHSAAWQYTSVSPKLSHSLDENIDYSGRFTL